MPGNYRANYDRTVANLRGQMDAKLLAALWAEGRAKTLDKAVDYALVEQVEAYEPIASAQPHGPNALTPREMEVLPMGGGWIKRCSSRRETCNYAERYMNLKDQQLQQFDSAGGANSK